MPPPSLTPSQESAPGSTSSSTVPSVSHPVSTSGTSQFPFTSTSASLPHTTTALSVSSLPSSSSAAPSPSSSSVSQSSSHQSHPHTTRSSSTFAPAGTATSASPRQNSGEASSEEHQVPVAAIVAATVIGSILLFAALYRLWMLHKRRKTRDVPLPPRRGMYADSDAGSRRTSAWLGADDLSYGAKTPGSTGSSLRGSYMSEKPSPAPLFKPLPVSSPLSSSSAYITDDGSEKEVRRGRPTSIKRESSQNSLSPHVTMSASVRPSSIGQGGESLSPGSGGTSSTSEHTHTAPDSVRPPEATYTPSVRSNTTSSLQAHRSQSRSSLRAGNNPSRRVSGAPHMPHVRSTIEIVLPTPLALSSASTSDVGHGASVSRASSHSSWRAPPTWSPDRNGSTHASANGVAPSAPSSWRAAQS